MAWVGYTEQGKIKTVHPVAWAGFEDGYLSIVKIKWDKSKSGCNFVGTAIKKNKSICVQDAAEDPQYFPSYKEAKQLGYRSGLALPLKDEKKSVFGVLVIYSEESNSFTSDEIRLLEELADDMAFGIITLRSRIKRRIAEEALREREEFLTSIVDNIPDMIFIKEAKELKFIRLNRAAERIFGHKTKDILGKSDYDFFPKEQASFFVQKDKEVLKNKKLYDIPEEPISTKHGERILHTKKLPILDKNGKPAYLLGISADITESKQVQESLKKSELEFRTVWENSPSGMRITDGEGTVIKVNKAFCNMFGKTKEELEGKPLSSIYSAEKE
jgi:PAS domain S-box-containing protein